jgi:A/G-specific adenine glycosylase
MPSKPTPRERRARAPRSDAPTALDAARAREIGARLEPWFLAHHRDLSWRRTRDPYAIWVSEIMLQQTRVETVERHWPGFIARFPDVATLAAADGDEVLSAWSGLGYYRRARMLHAGAKVVVAELDARLPEDAAGLRRIPGIGAYTAGAIASIAYDRPEPLVDGNVARVLSRLEAIEDPKQQDAAAKWLWVACEQILRSGTPRVLGQALMELGATVCTPRAPRCAACPVAASCRARARRLTDAIPAVRERAAPKLERWWAVAVLRDDAILLERRPDDGLLARMWCLPLLPRVDDDAAPTAAALRTIVRGRTGAQRTVGEPVVHVFTHRRWELQVLVVAAGPTVRPQDDAAATVWLGREEQPPGGVPTLTRKLLGRAQVKV